MIQATVVLGLLAKCVPAETNVHLLCVLAGCVASSVILLTLHLALQALPVRQHQGLTYVSPIQ